MKKQTFIKATMLLVLLFTAFAATAQSAVSWKATAKMTSKTEGVITITGTIQKGWHVYGFTQPADGPSPTSVTISGSKGVKLLGSLRSTTKPRSVFEEMFGARVTYWENKVVLTRKFKVTGVKTATATVKINYMACNDVSCQPPTTVTLNVKLK